MTQASDLIPKIRKLAHDEVAPYRHSDASIVDWLSDAQRTVVLVRPDAHTKLLDFTPVADQTEQDIAAISHLLVSVTTNKTTGKSIRKVELSTLDDFTPEWRTKAASANPEAWVTNPGSPTAFWLSPKPDTSVVLQVMATVTPTKLTATTDNFQIASVFDSAMMHAVLARLFEIDNNLESALLHSQSFAAELNIQSAAIEGSKAHG